MMNDDIKPIKFKHDASWYTASQDKAILEAWAGKGISAEVAAFDMGQNNGTYVSPEQFIKFAHSIGWHREDE